MLTAAFAVIIPRGKHPCFFLMLAGFHTCFGLWLKPRKPVLVPFPSSATASLHKVGNIFLPLLPNGNINQSLVNLDYVVCLAWENSLFSLNSGLLPVSALTLGYCYRISTIKNNRTLPHPVSFPSWQCHPQWKYYQWLVDPQF